MSCHDITPETPPLPEVCKNWIGETLTLVFYTVLSQTSGGRGGGPKVCIVHEGNP